MGMGYTQGEAAGTVGGTAGQGIERMGGTGEKGSRRRNRRAHYCRWVGVFPLIEPAGTLNSGITGGEDRVGDEETIGSDENVAEMHG